MGIPTVSQGTTVRILEEKIEAIIFIKIIIG
jgi:hypothetical protein